jgi:hypothetical protein
LSSEQTELTDLFADLLFDRCLNKQIYPLALDVGNYFDNMDIRNKYQTKVLRQMKYPDDEIEFTLGMLDDSIPRQERRNTLWVKVRPRGENSLGIIN